MTIPILWAQPIPQAAQRSQAFCTSLIQLSTSWEHSEHQLPPHLIPGSMMLDKPPAGATEQSPLSRRTSGYQPLLQPYLCHLERGTFPEVMADGCKLEKRKY